MNLIGIDYSINFPSVVLFCLDNNLDIIDKKFICFTQKKDFIYSKDSNEIYYYKEKDFKYYLDKIQWIRNKIIEWLPKNIDFVAIEDYAYHSVGKVFGIAEATIQIKMFLYDNYIPMRLYEPTLIKKFITEKGTADKLLMEENYEKFEDKIDLSFLPMISDNVNGNIKDNIVDSFCIAKLLQTELKLRRGIVNLRDLSEKRIEVFNQVSKAKEVNLLVREFIVKDKTNG